MSRTLVVYFSRTGTTRKVAGEITARAQAECEEIRESRGRRGLLGYLRSAREALARRIGEIDAPKHDPALYDLVVIGSPVWASNMSAPVRAYLTRHLGQFRRVAFFCTQGGSGGAKVVQAMAELCGQPPVATLVLNEREIRAGRHQRQLDAFVSSLETSPRNPA